MAEKTKRADIVFLQETYNTMEVENFWSLQWDGNLLFAYGTERVRDLEFELKQSKCDANGRSILLEAIIQDVKFYLCNIYSPKKGTG